MFKTILCIPPDYDRNFPPLGTPALAAFLKKKRIACSQIDLNLIYRDFLAVHVLGPSALNKQEQLFFLQPLINKFFSEKLKKRYYSEFLPRDSDGFFQRLPYGNNSNSSFYFCERLLSSEHLWRYLEDKNENTFYQFYESCGFIGTLEKERIDLLGISVISPAQVIASLTLGLMVKNRLPHIHVTIGGQWPTLYRNAILQKKDLFRCFDSVIVFEGESALYELAKRLHAKENISSIPNIIVCETVSDQSLTRAEEDMDQLPCPDFDGLDLNSYDGSKDGEISVTYETSRGCYWSKCAYCVDLPLPKPTYRHKRADLVVKDMQELKDKYNAQYLLFGDPGLSPRQMAEISKAMTEARVKMEWWTMARLDPGFNRELFDLAKRAGLRQINLGFESASDRICRLLDKGNQAERSSRIIRECSQAGIKVDLQTMIGLPGESFDDAMETIDFLVSHKEFISHVTFNTYYLTPFNHVHRNPRKYGIEYDNMSRLPFRFFIPFKNANGMAADWADQMEKIYRSLINKSGEGTPQALSRPAGPLSEGYAEFNLNNETVRLRYLRDPQTENYTFLQDDNEGAPRHEPACSAA
jgi:anaerobic magnesium-protoporphyrin IX monomethyl ester cyclase